MTDDTFNGWSSRETWAFVLHIDNDQGLQEWARELTEELVECHGTTAFNLVGERIVAGVEYLVHEMLLEGSPLAAESALMILRDVGSFWRIDLSEVGEAMIEAVTG